MSPGVPAKTGTSLQDRGNRLEFRPASRYSVPLRFSRMEADGPPLSALCRLNNDSDRRHSAMPHSLSAKKSLRHNQKTRHRNRQQRSQLRTELKKFRTLLADNPSREDADQAFGKVVKALDQAAAKRLIHLNLASRTKSRLAALKKSVCS